MRIKLIRTKLQNHKSQYQDFSQDMQSISQNFNSTQVHLHCTQDLPLFLYNTPHFITIHIYFYIALFNLYYRSHI